MSAGEPQSESTPRTGNVYLPALVLVGVAAVLATRLGPAVWIALIEQGSLTLAVVAAGLGWGAWPVVWLRLGRRRPLQQVCLSAGLGLGVLGLLTLALGLGGGLERWSAWLLVVIGGVLGIVRLSGRGPRPDRDPPPTGPAPNRWVVTLVLLTLAVPLSIGIFGATLPPGLLWIGEALGYDVLEYHLQGPREWFDVGRIHFLPHNVYTSFPQQMEMLYLLLMHLAGGPLAGAVPAQLLHAATGILAVVSIAAWTPAGWGRWVALVAAGSVPWMAYLGCLAYVELGVLLMGTLATGLVLDQFREDAGSRGRLAFTAGLCAGLAGGCKYTAVALVPTLLAVSWLLSALGTRAIDLRRLALFGVGALLAFSPWLARNWAWTGNPVHPFAYTWFDGRAWSPEQAEQWDRGHRLPPAQDTLTGRGQLVVREWLASRLFGPGLAVLALIGLIVGRSRPAALLALWAVLMLLTWAALTHMPGRFIVPVVVPLALLAGQVGTRGPAIGWVRGVGRVATGLAALAGVANSVTLAGLYHRHNTLWGADPVGLGALPGETRGLAAIHPVRELLPPAGRVWLVGEARAFYLPNHVHYTVVFSRDPWLEYARDRSPAEAVAWLRTQNVTHVVFSWNEIERLRASYGFPALVTREWAARLADAGLRRITPPADAASGETEVYEVPPP